MPNFSNAIALTPHQIKRRTYSLGSVDNAAGKSGGPEKRDACAFRAHVPNTPLS